MNGSIGLGVVERCLPMAKFYCETANGGALRQPTIAPRSVDLPRKGHRHKKKVTSTTLVTISNAETEQFALTDGLLVGSECARCQV